MENISCPEITSKKSSRFLRGPRVPIILVFSISSLHCHRNCLDDVIHCIFFPVFSLIFVSISLIVVYKQHLWEVQQMKNNNFIMFATHFQNNL